MLTTSADERGREKWKEKKGEGAGRRAYVSLRLRGGGKFLNAPGAWAPRGKHFANKGFVLPIPTKEF